MIQIITDTAADITCAQASALDVHIVSLSVLFGNEPYIQLEDSDDFSQFYQRLEKSKHMPVTSQPSPADFLPIFLQAKEKGDDVVAVLISSGLSGTVQSALTAKEMAEYSRIYIVDSRCATMAQRLLVEYAVSLRASETSVEELVAVLQDAVGRIRFCAAVDTLKYLHKGGRIPKSVEIVGTLLNIKPLLTLNSAGVIEMLGKARGHAGALANLVKYVDQNASFDPAVPFYFGYTHSGLPAVRNLQKILTARHHLTETCLYPVGGLVGAHVGYGAFALAYLGK